MKKIGLIVLFAVLLVFVGQAFAAPTGGYSIETVVGHSNGNHRLDCRVIRPWDSSSELNDAPYPVIAWANGWGQENVWGAGNTAWYIDEYLIDWALEGPYIVIAANAWSARESDVLKCLQWIADQAEEGGAYEGLVDLSRIGLAGHSQGAGALVKAGDGEPNGFEITAVLAMNPYGPSWVSAGDQDGQVLILTGANDTVTPETWTYPVFEALINNGVGGWYAVHDTAGHSDLDLYKDVIYWWWQYKLKGTDGAQGKMDEILSNESWKTLYTGGNGVVIAY